MLFRRTPAGYTPQLGALVGNFGMMAMPHQQYPWDPRLGLLGGGGGGLTTVASGTPSVTPTPGGGCGPGQRYAPGCNPCPPSEAAAQYAAAAYEEACRQEQALMMYALHVNMMKDLPTKGLAANSALVTAAGVTTRNVPGFTAQTILVTPSVPACITDWTISVVSTSFFEIQRLESSMQTYIGSDGPMPADSFAQNGTHPTMDWPTLWPGVPLTLVVFNTTPDPHEFRSTFHFIRGDSPGSCLAPR